MTSLVSLLTPSTDADGHAILYDYAWFKDGTKDDLQCGDRTYVCHEKGEVWRAEVTPRDLYGAGPTDVDSTTIQNTVPVLSSVALTPDPATVADTMACTPGTVTDYDGDAVTYAYAWKVNGVAIAATGSTLTGASFKRGESVVCIATPNDGRGDDLGLIQRCDHFEFCAHTYCGDIDTEFPGRKVDTHVYPSGAYDADGDSVSFDVEWYVNTSKISVTTSTLTGAFFCGRR